ncbi:MAG: polyprenyl synthetase family protein [Simkaniaceae bacterium]|nr:polyprenyl synthetase family protein [Simkaniaceae bacterium]
MLARHRSLLEERLTLLLSRCHERGGADSALYEAAGYALLSSHAKRLRPQILLAVLIDYGIPCGRGVDPACALEMIHTYSLIHDDLPAMDDDAFRRGRPTLHTAYGEAMAILTGDYLLTYAFEVLAHAPNLPAEKRIELITLFSRLAGGEGMIGGQVADIRHKGRPLDPDAIDTMFAKKTGALFVVAFESGALIAETPEKERTLLREAGYAFGKAYQYRDDLRDIEKDGEGGMRHGNREEIRKKANDLFLAGLRHLRTLSEEMTTVEAIMTSLQGESQHLHQ